MLKTHLRRAALLVTTFSMSYCVVHVPPGNPDKSEVIEVGSCAAVRAHLRNHAGDYTDEGTMAACGLSGGGQSQ